MNGIIYYNTPQTAETDHYGYYALNLYTGQQIWYNNGTNPITMAAYTGAGGVDSATTQTYPKLSVGQMLEINNVNGRGILSYLWEQGPAKLATFQDTPHGTCLTPSTGELILTLNNVPSGAPQRTGQGDL